MASSGYTDAVLLFGDSLTESWAAAAFAQRMSEFYNRKLDVVNRGFGGYNTEWAIPVFDQIFATTVARMKGRAQNVRLLTMWFGANDSVLPGESQHVPLEKYKTNLSTLVSFVRSPTSPYFSPDTKIIMITPPPIIETLFNEHLKAQLREQGQSAENMRASRRKEVTEKYAIACYDVAKEERLPVVDMHSSIIEAAGGEADDQLERFFTDGLHLSSAGYEVLYQKLTELIIATYPELDPETMTQRIPSYTEFEISPENGFAKVTKHKEMRSKGQP